MENLARQARAASMCGERSATSRHDPLVRVKIDQWWHATGDILSQCLKQLFFLLLALSVVSATANGQATAPQTKELQTAELQITDPQKWKSRLGNPSYTIRREATMELWAAGEAGYRLARTLVDSADREVSTRANWLIRQWRFGIRPDTPPSVAQWITKYQKSQQNEKAVLLRKLLDKGEVLRLLSLIATEADRDKRILMGSIKTPIRNAVRTMIGNGEIDRALDALKLGAEADELFLADYAACLMVLDRMEETRDSLRKQGIIQSQRNLLAICEFNSREFERAKKTCLTGTPDTTGIRLQSRIGLIESQWKMENSSSIERGDKIEKLSMTLLGQKATNDQLRFAETMKEIVELGTNNKEEARFCAEAMLICNAWPEAIDFTQSYRITDTLRLRLARLEVRESLELLGVEDASKLPDWFRERTAQKKDNEDEQKKWDLETYECMLILSPVLNRLGQRKELAEILDHLAKYTRDERTHYTGNMIKGRLSAEMREAAFEDAVIGLEAENKVVISRLFPKNYTDAKNWWAFLSLHGNKPLKEKLLLLDAMILGEGERPDTEAYTDLIAKFEQHIDRQPADKQLLPRLSLVKSARTREEKQAVIDLFEQRYAQLPEKGVWLFSSSQLQSLAFALGNLLASEERWQEAAEWYDRCVQHDPKEPRFQFALGHVLEKLGKPEEAKARKQRGRLLPLSLGRVRTDLAKQMDSLQLAEEAKEQRRITMESGFFSNEFSTVGAARDAAVDLFDEKAPDKLLQTSLINQSHLRLLAKSNAYIDIRSYPIMASRIARTRALGLLDNNRVEEAIHDMWVAHEATPGDVRIPLEIAPRLEKNGKTEVAQEIFEKVYQVNQKLLDDFPNSAYYHNEIAWLCARLGRRMDDAFVHAKKAVELQPDYPNSIDTLAEVYYRQGNREKAIELVKRCIELDPNTKHFHEQLVRFEAGQD